MKTWHSAPNTEEPNPARAIWDREDDTEGEEGGNLSIMGITITATAGVIRAGLTGINVGKSCALFAEALGVAIEAEEDRADIAVLVNDDVKDGAPTVSIVAYPGCARHLIANAEKLCAEKIAHVLASLDWLWTGADE